MDYQKKFLSLPFSERFDYIYKEILKYSEIDLLEALEINRFAISQAEKLEDQNIINRFLYVEVSLHIDMGDPLDFIPRLFDLLKHAKKRNDFILMSKYYNAVATIYSHNGNLYQAYRYFWKAVYTMLKSENPEFIYVIYLNIGFLYNKMGYYQNALEILSKALTALKEHDNPASMSNAYCVIGYTYYNLKKFQKAQDYLNHSINMKNAQNSLISRNICNLHIAEILVEKKAFSDAEYILKEIVANLEKRKSNYWLLNSLVLLSRVKLSLNKETEYLQCISKAEKLTYKVDQAEDSIRILFVKASYFIQKNDFPQAQLLYQEAYDQAKEKNLKVLMSQILEERIRLFINANQYMDAFLLQEQRNLIREKIQNESNKIYLNKFKNDLREFQEKIDYYSSKTTLLSSELENLTEKTLIGVSKAIKLLYEKALNLAKYENLNVLITGESGTGKEIIARIIHFAGNKKNAPFIPVNSSAIPEHLIESEFFGHKKGSFTGAGYDKKGLFQEADKGTLFLDEIGDMPLHMQAKLLRVIEEKKIKRIGDTKEFPVTFRIIAATNKNLVDEVEKGHFRLDLYHRLSANTLFIPPLRERKEDIPQLIAYFLKKLSSEMKVKTPQISLETETQLIDYSWPGNVRELRNIIESLILNSADQIPKSGHLFINKTSNHPEQSINKKHNLKVEDHENELMLQALAQTDGNKTHAARLLGISRDTLLRKMKKRNLTYEPEHL